MRKSAIFPTTSLILCSIALGPWALAQAPLDMPLPRLEVKTGEVLYITVQVEEPDPVVVGIYRNYEVPFFRIGPEGRYGGLLGIDLADEPGQEELVIQVTGNPEMRPIKRYVVEVHPNSFGVQKLTLPKDRVDLDPKTLKRVRLEQKLMMDHLSGFSQDKLWRGPFMVPVEGRVAGTFGQQRIINGQSRNPHTGEDIAAPERTPIVAPNDGVVILTGDFFFNGKSIVLDHGLGLFTMYFHLSEISVRDGDYVERGQTIGRVGATGRATGPHLHWGARINGARINPFSLLNFSFDPGGN